MLKTKKVAGVLIFTKKQQNLVAEIYATTDLRWLKIFHPKRDLKREGEREIDGGTEPNTCTIISTSANFIESLITYGQKIVPSISLKRKKR